MMTQCSSLALKITQISTETKYCNNAFADYGKGIC